MTFAQDQRRYGLPAHATAELSAVAWRRGVLVIRAFTLIELILVMALMAIMTSIAMPSLSHFFRGRETSSEARQLLSLTHDAQSRAVSEGFPMLLWIDSIGRSYGLQAETVTSSGAAGQDVDTKAEEYGYSDKVQIDVINASPVTVGGKTLPAIRFLPDGSIDETSPNTVRLTGLNGDVLWLLEATNHLRYEVRNTDQ